MKDVKQLLLISPKDNVAVALADLKAGQTLPVADKLVTAVRDIPQGHKISIIPISQGSMVIKYGAPIGHAREAIQAGEWVHTHNLKTNLSGTLEYTYNPALTPASPRQPGTFQGFARENSQVGIRNEIWIIPTVGCVNTIAAMVEKQSQKLIRGGVEGIYAFPHPYGCSQMGEDHENTKKALCGLIRHPNAGGVLVLGLGCENNTIDGMKEMLGDYDPCRVKFLNCQDVKDEVEAALALMEQLVEHAAVCQRQELPLSGLVVGLKCGGSDGLSGITANPLVGAFADRLIAEGGAAILTEVPEMFGAETLLMNRCGDEELFGKTVRLINEFKDYYLRHGQVVYENSSPGNKVGGDHHLGGKIPGLHPKRRYSHRHRCAALWRSGEPPRAKSAPRPRQ